MRTYEEGAALGCPDCAGGEEHCCPFMWADEQPEPMRTWAMKHMAGALADVIEEVKAHGA